MTRLRWILAAAASAVAAWLSVRHDTPVDAALPVLALGVTAAAAASYSSLMLGAPLLVVASLTLGDEQTRLLSYGVILAAVFGVAVAAQARGRSPGVERSLLVTAAAVVLLRWIAVADLPVVRELFLLVPVLLLVVVLDGTPFGIALAVTAALFTPAIPLRTLALPVAIVAAAIAIRAAGIRAPVLAAPSAAVVGVAMLFFAWSGVVARGLPWIAGPHRPKQISRPVGEALAAGRSLELEVPAGTTALVVSGANVSRLRRGAVLGRVDPDGRAIRIGDAADWGAMRREQAHGSRNPFPRDSAGLVRGYGYEAWIDGAGRVPLPAGVERIRITADPSLAPDASLQVEGFESAGR